MLRSLKKSIYNNHVRFAFLTALAENCGNSNYPEMIEDAKKLSLLNRLCFVIPFFATCISCYVHPCYLC